MKKLTYTLQSRITYLEGRRKNGVSNVNFRLDENVKKEMEEACHDMGMSMTTAFTIFAKRVERA